MQRCRKCGNELETYTLAYERATVDVTMEFNKRVGGYDESHVELDGGSLVSISCDSCGAELKMWMGANGVPYNEKNEE